MKFLLLLWFDFGGFNGLAGLDGGEVSTDRSARSVE